MSLSWDSWLVEMDGGVEVCFFFWYAWLGGILGQVMILNWLDLHIEMRGCGFWLAMLEGRNL